MRLTSKRTTLVVCDSCPMIYCGIQKTFEANPWIEVTGEVSSLCALHDRLLANGADVAVIDCDIVPLDHAETVHLLKRVAERTYVILYGAIRNANHQKTALEIGVRGILSRHHSARYIRRSILKVADGGIWLEPVAAESLLHHVFSGANEESERVKTITRREHKVMELVCRGLRNKQIAAELAISETTVCHHLTSIFSKLGVSDRVALVTFAYRHELHVPISVERSHKGQLTRRLNPVAVGASQIAC